MKYKVGDSVIIIAGKDRGKTGQIEAVLPHDNRVAVTGINKYKKHVKPSAKNINGGVIEVFRPIHASNIMVIDPETQKPTRVGIQRQGRTINRIARITGKPLGK